ncbi:MAG: hypothetical protein AB2693_01965 [Candidatus Thiodiazotropha sp.]
MSIVVLYRSHLLRGNVVVCEIAEQDIGSHQGVREARRSRRVACLGLRLLNRV